MENKSNLSKVFAVAAGTFALSALQVSQASSLFDVQDLGSASELRHELLSKNGASFEEFSGNENIELKCGEKDATKNTEHKCGEKDKEHKCGEKDSKKETTKDTKKSTEKPKK